MLSKESSHIKSVSSANCNKQHSTLFLPTFRPLRTFILSACLTNPAKLSATTKKRNGAIGSPCLNPLEGLNSSVGLPLTSTDTDDETKHPLTHKIYLSWKPSLWSISNKNLHLTESYAFSKSTLKHTPLFPFLFISSRTSLAITTLSNNPLPQIKAY